MSVSVCFHVHEAGVGGETNVKTWKGKMSPLLYWHIKNDYELLIKKESIRDKEIGYL